MPRSSLCAPALLVIGMCLSGCASLRRLPLVIDGTSGYVIHHAPDAPATVKAAAQELQRVVRISTGVTLPISETPGAPMISLGANASVRQAGFAPDALPYEAFRVVTRARDLYIFGNDTPDGEKTPRSGFSRGTQFGVFTFLEDVVGVRWIMPGEWGEEIPRHQRLRVPALDRRDEPAFLSRSLGIHDPPVVKEWALRHKISSGSAYRNTACSFVPCTSHYWDAHLPEELRRKQPEWDAVNGEENKFCTRQPAAVRAFAENAVAWLDLHGDWHMASASPSDGQSFCRCERCAAHNVKDPHGQRSVTVNILDFYNAVARAVAAARPGRMVGGYAYGRYTYPPAAPVRIEPNLFIEWTALNYYGMGLYKPAYRAEFERVAAGWRALTENVGYHNYCHWHRSHNGAPYGPAREVMKLQFPILKKYGYMSIREYGTSAWAYGGPNNYLLAKLMWNAQADVDALYAEWLQLAYGAAEPAMAGIYALLDDGFREFKTEHESFHYHGDNYEILSDKIRTIYLPRLARLEALYRDALALTARERTRRRVQMFGDNMVVFHYNLRKAGYLAQPETSFFYRSDTDFAAFLAQSNANVFGGPGPGWLWLGPYLKPLTPPFEGEERVFDIPALASGRAAPVVDGALGADEWRGAAVATAFRCTRGQGPARAVTRVRAVYDRTALYLAFECTGPGTGRTTAPGLKRDDMRIFAGNAVEAFFTPTGKPNRYWHLVVDSANNRWDGLGSDPAPDLAWESAVGKGDRQWTVELAIPFAALKVNPRTLQSWRANLGRTQKDGRAAEHSTWNRVRTGFLEPMNFGVWRFSANP